MSEPDNDKLRDALRSWDPVLRTSDGETEVVFDGVRRDLRSGAGEQARQPFPVRWVLAGAAMVAVVTLAVVLLPRGKDVERRLGATAAGREKPVQLTMVAANGVRVYWTIDPEPAVTVDSDGSRRMRRAR